MNKELKKLIRFGTFAIVILFGIDLVTGRILGALYDRMTVGEKARANYFIKSDKSEIIIFGSSRALYHYHSGLISDSLKMTTYNAGRSNQSILYHTTLLKCIVKRHKPKVVVLDLQADEFVYNRRKYERLSALLPYYKLDGDVSAIYNTVRPGYKYFAWSHSLPYNSSVFATLYRGTTSGRDNDINGFMIRKGKVSSALTDKENNCGENLTMDSILIQSFEDFHKICQDANIELVVNISPEFSRYVCERKEFTILKNEIRKRGVLVNDCTEVFENERMFADKTHLSLDGAIEYSNMVVETLKSKLQKKPE